jgi:MFS family permease
MTPTPAPFRGNDKLLFGMILGVFAFWLFAQTPLNIAPAMASDLSVPTSVMNIAVSITALFSGIFIVVIGGLADRLGRVKILMWGFVSFYATPSTDAALSNLPGDQAGSGAGIYKMASSLGASFGVAISAAIFTALSANDESIHWLDGVITFTGRQDNVAVRQAALIALGFNLLMVVAAIVSIMLTVPKTREGKPA